MNARRLAISAGSMAVALVLLGSLAWGLQHAALTAPSVLGRPAPHLAIQTVGGQQVRVWELQGRPVVVNFWASWCAPCAQELPVLSEGYSAHPDVRFVGAAMQDTASGVAGFESLHPHPYPAGPIVSGSYQDYGVVGLPVTFFISAQGVVAASFAGPLDAPTLNHYLGLITS